MAAKDFDYFLPLSHTPHTSIRLPAPDNLRFSNIYIIGYLHPNTLTAPQDNW